MARKIIKATGEEVVETRTHRQDKEIPPDEIVVRIRGQDGNVRADQMTIQEYRDLQPELID